jgi:hypothetical protein
MNNNDEIIEINRDSVVSFKSYNNEIKENRKFISNLLRLLSHKKNLQSDLIRKECIEILRTYERDITVLYDEEKNTCKFVLIKYCIIVLGKKNLNT